MRDERALVTLLTMVSNTLMIKHEVSEATMKIWWECLLEYDDELVGRAVMAHLKDPVKGAFFPAPADIIRHAIEIRSLARLSKKNPELAGPKREPPAWAKKFFEGMAFLSKTHRGLPWPTELSRKLVEEARSEARKTKDKT